MIPFWLGSAHEFIIYNIIPRNTNIHARTKTSID